MESVTRVGWWEAVFWACAVCAVGIGVIWAVMVISWLGVALCIGAIVLILAGVIHAIANDQGGDW